MNVRWDASGSDESIPIREAASTAERGAHVALLSVHLPGGMLVNVAAHPSLSVVGSKGGDDAAREGTGSSPPGGQELQTTTPPEPPKPLSMLFEVTKAEVDLQFKLAERFDSKGRGFFTIAAAFFAATQTIALRSDVLNSLAADQKDRVLIIASFAAAALGMGMFALWALTRPTADMEFEPQKLRDRLNEIDEPYAADHIVNSYISLLEERQSANATRRRRLTFVQFDGMLVIAISAFELIVALNLFS